MSTETNVAVKQGTRTSVRTIVQVGMLGALATILMMFDFPLPFAPSFYKIDLSEVVKILVNLVLTGSGTGGVGEIANFIIGCAFCVPAGIIYRRNRTRKNALIGMITGIVVMTVLGCFVNAYVLLPVYSKAFGMPIDALVGMGTAVNSHITSLTTFVLLAVAPFNLLKGVVVSLIVFLIYKKISPVFKMGA